MPLKTKSAPKEHLGLTTRQKMKKYRAFYIMFIPLFLCLILFSYLPMFGILYAFTDYTPFKPAQFVGLQNFQKLFSQAGFWKAFFNTLQISITKLVIDTLGSIVLALLLDELHLQPRIAAADRQHRRRWLEPTAATVGADTATRRAAGR